MPLILTTGLDGSGKSTLISKLETALTKDVFFLRVPTIDKDKFSENKTLFEVGRFVNDMGTKADELKQPNLKIISIFSSMLIFRDLQDHLELDNPKIVFCERHPLVDTAVYGKAYIKALKPDELNEELAKSIHEEYSIAIEKLESILSKRTSFQAGNFCLNLLTFLQEWFGNEDNYTFEKLSALFNVSSPDEVYLLSAPPEILIDRLSSRASKEYHETLEIISKMQPLYPWILNKTKQNYTSINAETWTETDQLFDTLKSRFS